jgi:hypothetical protein
VKLIHFPIQYNEIIQLIHKAHSFIDLIKLKTDTLSSHSAALMGGLWDKNCQVNSIINQHYEINTLIHITHLHYNYINWIDIWAGVYHYTCSHMYFITWIHTSMPWNNSKLNCDLTVLNHTMKNAFSRSMLKSYSQFVTNHDFIYQSLAISSLRSFALKQSLPLQNSCKRLLLLVNKSVSFSAKVHHASLYIVSYYGLAYWNQ